MTTSAPTGLPSLEEIRLTRCQRSFTYFLQFWSFINRETGQVSSFRDLWPGQRQAAQAMEDHNWVFCLKAGKLGFTELECAFDAWRARFGEPNSRVHLFSVNRESASDLLGYVKYGLSHLPEWMRWPIGNEIERGGQGVDNSREFVIANPLYPLADRRTIVSYPVVRSVSIDQTCQHAHLDELSHIGLAKQLLDGVSSTIAPHGTCHIVTRGAGEDAYTAQVWAKAKAGDSLFYPMFVPWSGRPDRNIEWYAAQQQKFTELALRFYAPETESDALASPDESVYIPVALWDQCEDKEMPPLRTLAEGDTTPVVIALDAATYSDTYHMAVVSRNPKNTQQAALRFVMNWSPGEFGGRIDHTVPEEYLKQYCATHNVVQVAYDPFQLEPLRSRVDKEGWAWMEPFSQMSERQRADTLLHSLVMRREFVHNGDQLTREHIKNARALVDKQAPDKIRIIKNVTSGKVDGAVATAMAVHRILSLNVA